MYYIVYEELSHHGVKGMKWGVRKDKYSKEQISARRKELIDKAPYSDGHRRSSSSPPTKGYWKNASDSQIARLMAYEEKQKKRELKKELKKKKAFEKEYNRTWYQAYNNATYDFNSKLKTVNKKYDGKELGDNFETKAGQKYVREVNNAWKISYTKALQNKYVVE